MVIRAQHVTLAEYTRILEDADVHRLMEPEELLAYRGSHNQLGTFIALIDGDGMLLIFDEAADDTAEFIKKVERSNV